MTQPDWDDDRLDAAFHARFDRPAPTDLAKDVHVRIAGTSPARFAGIRTGRAWTLAAAAVVVVLVSGTALVGLGGLGRSGGGPPLASGASTGAPGPIPTPTEQALPGSVFDGELTIIGVSDAIAIRDAGVDDRELAIHGWFTPGIPTGGCATQPRTSPIQGSCPEGSIWLTQDAESLIHRDRLATTVSEPVSPALRPSLLDLDMSWQRPDLRIDANGNSAPTDVVFVGHFDDRRAALCPEGELTACRDTFVVDSVAIVEGQTLRRSETGTEDARSRVAQIETIVGNEAPASRILSMSVVDTDRLAFLEPSLAPMLQGSVDHPRLWVVRVLESERVVTYAVIDGSDAIYEMNPDNEAILVGGEPPEPSRPSAPASVWPPTGAQVIALTSEVGAGQPPVQVAVVDQSGRLDGVSEKGSVDPTTRTLDRRLEAYAEPAVSPGRVHLAWVGSICDSQITVTVAKDVKTIFFDMGPLVDCDSIGIGRELVLDFSGLVVVPEIDLVDVTGKPQSSTDPASYAVDCGPIDQDACMAKATEIAAATPDKRIVSLTFTDVCGSYRAAFSDDTGHGADIDCITSPAPS